MRGVFIFLIFLFFATSCKDVVDGRIEMRKAKSDCGSNSRSFYLINSSPSKELLFTVKKTTIINDSIYLYSSDQYRVDPGDEKFLGCEFEYGNEKYKEVNIVVKIDSII